MIHTMQSSENSVAFIYEYGKEIWSTPSSLMEEFESIGWHVSRYHLSKMNKDEELSLFDLKPDMCIIMDWKGIDISMHVKNKLRNIGSYMVRECGDTPQNYDNHLKVCDGYNLILTPDYPSALKYQAIGYDTLWSNHFADSKIHDKSYFSSDNLPPVRSTRGQNGSLFMDDLSLMMPQKFINKNGFTGHDYGAFLSNGKITLQNSRWKEITRRIFEGAACGTMVLTDRLSKETMIDELFIEDENIVYYDDYNDCISKINYYLSPEGESERIRIAKNGYDLVHTHHTQKQRVESIIEKYNTWKTNSQ